MVADQTDDSDDDDAEPDTDDGANADDDNLERDGGDGEPSDSVEEPNCTLEGGSDAGAGFQVTFSGDGVECGAETCLDAELDGLGYGASACCADEGNSLCGLDMSVLGLFLKLSNPGCEVLDKAGSCDPACGASGPIPVIGLDAPDEGLTLPGCCQADGVCGFQANFGGFGFGCVGAERFVGQDEGADCTYEP
jgi:hypothetical protein